MSQCTVDTMYIQWLSGLSIRKIGRAHGIGRMTVYSRFVLAYGKDCCNLRKQSLARVVMKEYGDLALAMVARGSSGLYRTKKTEDNYSRTQSTDLADYHLTYPVDTANTCLRLSYYMAVSKITTRLVYLTMMSRMNRLGSS